MCWTNCFLTPKCVEQWYDQMDKSKRSCALGITLSGDVSLRIQVLWSYIQSDFLGFFLKKKI
jgi:hypothetical protein